MNYFNTILFSRAARFFFKDKSVPDKCFALHIDKLKFDICDCKYFCKYKSDFYFGTSTKMPQCTN